MHLIAWITVALQKPDVPGPVQTVLDFLDTPAPYSPFSEYIAVLFLLWLLARRTSARKKTFDTKAQDVLDQKLAAGEIDRKTYDKFRQDVSLRPKR